MLEKKRRKERKERWSAARARLKHYKGGNWTLGSAIV
jgi:hypothetical protein